MLGERPERRIIVAVPVVFTGAVMISGVLESGGYGRDPVLGTLLVPSWPSHGWLALLALTSQVLGWLLISVSLPRLPAALTSVLLLVQPVGSIVLAVIILGEDPSALQLAGTAVILAGICVATLTWPRVDVKVSSH